MITETNAQVTDADVNFAEVGACPIDISEHDSTASSKKNRIETFNISAQTVPKSAEIAIAYEYDLPRMLAGTIQARPIRVMESFRNIQAEAASR